MTMEEMTALHGAETVMRAHQFLYYVRCCPVMGDYEYDKWCSKNGLFGGGGSDREQDYSYQEKLIAEKMLSLSNVTGEGCGSRT